MTTCLHAPPCRSRISKVQRKAFAPDASQLGPGRRHMLNNNGKARQCGCCSQNNPSRPWVIFLGLNCFPPSLGSHWQPDTVFQLDWKLHIPPPEKHQVTDIPPRYCFAQLSLLLQPRWPLQPVSSAPFRPQAGRRPSCLAGALQHGRLLFALAGRGDFSWGPERLGCFTAGDLGREEAPNPALACLQLPKASGFHWEPPSLEWLWSLTQANPCVPGDKSCGVFCLSMFRGSPVKCSCH